MTTRNEIVYAYRLLLGREPENEAVVERHLANKLDLEALRSRFLRSDEFRAKLGKIEQGKPMRTPRTSPAMVVELDAPPAKLQALFAKVSAQWHHLGATEPHWSVLTNDSFRSEQLGANRGAFYASGKADAEAFVAALQRGGIHPDQGGRLLEVGCGVGRVTAHLARHAKAVVGVDISAAHLRLAEQHMQESGIDNVTFSQLRGIDDVAQLGQFDAVFSVIVLQHNPPPVIVRMLRDLLALLRPGGVAFFQLPTYRTGYRFVIDEYLAHQNEKAMEMHFVPQSALFELLEAQDCRLIDLREDDGIGNPSRAISNTLLVQKRGSRS